MGLPTVQLLVFFFSSRRRHTRFDCDWSSDVCSSDLAAAAAMAAFAHHLERWLESASDQFALGEDDFNFHLHYEHALRDTAPELWRRSEERRVGKEGRSRWSPDH